VRRQDPLVEVAPGVHVATSVVYATTSTVVVGDGGTCLVVDPGVTADELDGLGRACADRGWRPVAVWSTHGHWDHRLDGPVLRGVPRFAVPRPPGRAGSDERARLAAERDADDELARVLSERPGDRAAPIAPVPRAAPLARVPEPLRASLTGPWAGLDLAGWRGPTILVLTHRAHSPDSSALLVPAAGVLVAGDLLSDVEIPLLDEDAADPVADHRAALAALASTHAALVVPGHGRPGDDLAARVARDRAYLDALTADVRSADAGPHDARLSCAWQRATHDRQRALARRS